MNEPELKTSEFMGMMQDEYAKFSERSGRWRPPIAEFARYLGVSAASLDQWLIGSRTPDLQNAVRLAEKLGSRVYDVLGFPRMAILDDPKLKFIVEQWDILSDDAIAEILTIFEREAGRAP